MKVSDLAKEFDITSEDILSTLRSLKLKAKDSKQELSDAVVAVLRRQLKKNPKISSKKDVSSKKTKVSSDKKEKAPSVKRPVGTKTKSQKTPKKKTETKVRKIKSRIPKTKKKKTTVSAKKKTVVKKIAHPTASLSKVSTVTSKELSFSSGPVAVQPAPAVQKKPQVMEKPRVTVEKKKEILKSSGPEHRPPLEESQERIRELKALELSIPISVKDLSVCMQQKPSEVLKVLLQKGIFANINQSLDEDVVKVVLDHFGFTLAKLKSFEEQLVELHEAEDDPKALKPRSPVITLMGHVDHGKTSLLDKIRKSKIADEEHGGITQHIGAYAVRLPKGQITFLDTPGHEAFTSMRARGAHITDLVVLVVAADEGVMPQTEEAINHARAAEVPIVVALNKIDRKAADVDRVKKELDDRGLTPEDWGGQTIVVGVSAVTGEGIDTLLDMILLESEMLELKANPDKMALGVVLEAHLSRGRGAVASVIVQNGTLHEGDVVIAGPYFGRVKAILDDHERPLRDAGPSTPVEIIGLSGVPDAGEIFYVVEDGKKAKEIAEARQEKIKNKKLQTTAKVSLEDLYAQIQEGKIKTLNLVLKADVQGSLEALKDQLAKIPSDQVQLKFIHTGMGEVNNSDVILAAVSNAIIIAFHVDINVRAQKELEKQQVDLRKYRLIYDAVSDIRKALEGLLEPKLKKKILGRVEVRQVFKLSRGIIAGCYVVKGKIHRKVDIDLLRNGDILYTGKISSLKRFKDDVREVSEGFECGITLDKFDEVQEGDIIEAFETESIARKL